MLFVRGTLIVVFVIALAALAPSASAQEQARITETEIQLAVNPFLSEGNTLARGDSTFGFLVLQFCHGAGGFNPQEGMFDFTFEFTGNEPWFEVRLSSEPTQSFMPPRGPTFNQQQDCPADGSLQWDVTATATNQAPYDGVGEIQITMKVAESGNLGTYKLPAEKTALMSVKIEPDPGENILTNLENATKGPSTPTPSGGGGASEEGPVPAMPAIVLTFIALVAVLRRRD